MKSEYFTFDKKKSLDMGYISVRVGGGDAKVELLGDRSTDYFRFAGKEHFFVKDVKKEPLTFTLQIIPINEKQWTNEMYSEVCEWLIHDDYKEFISEDNPSKVYYAIAKGATNWQGVFRLGYMEIEFETNANHAWSFPENISYTVTGEKEIEINNMKNIGDRLYKPILKIKKTNSTGDISIINMSDENRETKLTNLKVDEYFDMDNEYRLFISPTPTNYYGNHFNKKWLTLKQGINRLKIIGDCEIVFRCQYPIV